MEAIINRAPGKRVEDAAAGWLLEARRIARAALGAIGHAPVDYSRAAMLLRGGNRPFRRL